MRKQGGRRRSWPPPDERAVVTGAASGIGRAVAQRLRNGGVGVLAVDIDAERLKPSETSAARSFVAELGDPAARERLAAATQRLRLSRQRRGHSPGQADPRGHGRGLAGDTDGQRRVGVLPVPANRRAAQPGRRYRQLVLEFGEAGDIRRRRRLCGLQDDHTFDHALLRLRARRPPGARQRDLPGIVDTRDAGALSRRRRGAARRNARPNSISAARRSCR